MSADWNMWLLTVIAITSSIAAFAQGFNAIHQLWINLHNIRQFCSKKLERAHGVSGNSFHRSGFREFEDFVDIPTVVNITPASTTYAKPESVFFADWLDDSKIHRKMGAVVMSEDIVRRYLMNPNASLPINRIE